MEQARYQASQQRPEDVVDPAEFVRNLNPSLRRQVLADMDDTVLAVLPPELSSEAQGLRREVEQRQLQRQRSTFSQMIQRHQDMANRYGSSGFQLARIFPRGQMNYGCWCKKSWTSTFRSRKFNVYSCFTVSK